MPIEAGVFLLREDKKLMSVEDLLNKCTRSMNIDACIENIKYLEYK